MRATIELDRFGKHTGALVAPRSTDTSAWAQLTVPIVSIKSGAGPTVLVLAGSHGDEYEGQVVVAQLAQELEQTAVTISHDLELLLDYDRVLVVDGGRIVADDVPGSAIDFYKRRMGA